MMTYREANSVLNSNLHDFSVAVSDSRCISKGVGKDNGADWKDTQDHTSAMTTFMNRNGGASLFPDMRLMPVEAIQNGAPFELCRYPLDDKLMDLAMSSSTGDAGALGYNFEVVDITYDDENTAGWLTVETHQYGDGQHDYVLSQLWDPLTDTYSPAVTYRNSRSEDAAFMSTRHEARVRYRVTKNSQYNENSATQMKDACETFFVTVQCGQNNSGYLAQFNNATNKTLRIEPNYSQANGAICEYAVEVSGIDAYWKADGVVGSTTAADMISVSSGGISIDFSKLPSSQGTGNTTFTLYGNWTGSSTSNPTGLPVVPHRGSNSVTFRATVNDDNAQTSKISVYAEGNLNMYNATKEEIAERCTSIMKIVYNPSDGTVNISNGDKGGEGYIFYPKTANDTITTQNFTWINEGRESRNYAALAVARKPVTVIMETGIKYEGGDYSSPAPYKVEKADNSDPLTYNIDIFGNQFTIDFTNIPEVPVTKTFKLTSIAGWCPEYANISFTFNE